MGQQWRNLGTTIGLVALLAAGLPPPAHAAPPDGLLIGGTATVCTVRQGGYAGYRIDWAFDWHLQENAVVGPSATVEGTYSLQVRDPVSGQFEALFTEPYAFALQANDAERRSQRRSPRDLFWAFDQVKLEVNWQVVGTDLAGTETAVLSCTIEPAPVGKEPIAKATLAELTAAVEAADAANDEVFVHQADRSPLENLTVDSALYCRETRRGQEVSWLLLMSHADVRVEDGAAVAGAYRVYTRTDTGSYVLRREQPFGDVVAPRETRAVDGYFRVDKQEAAKLEVEWRASPGTVVQPGASTQRILRTTECE